MPKLAVVAYPELEADDRAWIESIRALRDPQASLLPAHVTLVFPNELATDEAVREVRSVANQSQSITFTLRWARADIPFIPHITIGANSDFDACEKLARELTPLTRLIHGRISRIGLIEITATAVETVKESGLL